LENLYKDSKKKRSSKAIKMLASDHRLKKIYIELKKNQEYSPENLTHPKYQVLDQIVLDGIEKLPESRVLVFVKLRTSVRNIVSKLKENETVKCKRFVGQAHKSKQDKGLSQKEQLEILDLFKNGQYNVLVSTNVGEEGLDIAECDLVIFYDVVASEISLIQRKGRTARRRKGRLIIIYCKNTDNEIYLRIALSKLKKMNVNLRNTKQLKNYYEQKNGEDTDQEQEIINKIRKFKDTKIKKQLNLQHYI